MGKRGPKSSVELKVIQGDFGRDRPEPPPDLTPEQIGLWRRIVQDEPIDFFATAVTRDLLKDYCRVRSAVEFVSANIDQFPRNGLRSKDGRKLYLQLAQIHREHIRAMASLATKLRLTNQSRYTPQVAATSSRNTAKGIKPWEM
jgi:hypothetical protein